MLRIGVRVACAEHQSLSLANGFGVNQEDIGTAKILTTYLVLLYSSSHKDGVS